MVEGARRSRRNIAMLFGKVKLERLGYPTVKTFCLKMQTNNTIQYTIYNTLIYVTFSQPELTKLYNENISGHHYICTLTLNNRDLEIWVIGH